MIRKSTPAVLLKKLIGAAAVGVAMCAASFAQAGVLDFETPVDSPLVLAGQSLTMGKYWVDAYGSGFVGAVGTSESCFDVQCPVNNPSNYYSALNDGYLAFGLLDGSEFSLGSLDASFIGAGAASYPAVAALLYLEAYNASGFVDSLFLELSGPVGGNFNFASYGLTGFGGGALFTEVLIASYACDAAGNCNRNTNQANFALDNIITIDANEVPEPGTLALMGLGLLGLRAMSRSSARRAA